MRAVRLKTPDRIPVVLSEFATGGRIDAKEVGMRAYQRRQVSALGVCEQQIPRLDEYRRGSFVGVHHDGGRVGRARRSPFPVSEAPPRRGGRRQRHFAAVRIHVRPYIQGHRSVADLIDSQRARNSDIAVNEHVVRKCYVHRIRGGVVVGPMVEGVPRQRGNETQRLCRATTRSRSARSRVRIGHVQQTTYRGKTSHSRATMPNALSASSMRRPSQIRRGGLGEHAKQELRHRIRSATTKKDLDQSRV